MLRCHAFASNVNRQQKNNWRRTFTLGLNHKTKNYNLVIRGGGSGSNSNSRNPFRSSEAEATSRLSSTASPLRDSGSVTVKEDFERRVLNSLPIASGGPVPTSIKSFGGIPYQDTSSSKLSSVFRVVFVLGGPGKSTLNPIGNNLNSTKRF